VCLVIARIKREICLRVFIRVGVFFFVIPRIGFDNRILKANWPIWGLM